MSTGHVGWCLLSCLVIPYFIWYRSPCYEVNNMLVCLPRILRVSKNRRMSMFLSFQMDIQLDVCRQTVTRVVNKRTDEKGADSTREKVWLRNRWLVGNVALTYRTRVAPDLQTRFFVYARTVNWGEKLSLAKCPGRLWRLFICVAFNSIKYH